VSSDIEGEGAAEALAAVMNDHAAVLGPSIDDDEVDETTAPVGELLLCEWVAVMAWVDEQGQRYTTQVTLNTMPAHHRKGLLFEALHGFE
jgi:hypothetical protein